MLFFHHNWALINVGLVSNLLGRVTFEGFSKNRHGRFRDSDTFRHVFESVLRRCMTEGLVEGERFAIDASVVRADANRARGVPGR